MAFTGFKKEGIAFFKELALRQDRDWFKAHKHRYDDLWDGPLHALLDEVTPLIARQYKGLALAEPKFFRLYRDVRFSKDKSPFKTHVAAVIVGKKGQEAGAPAALYVHLGLDEAAGAGHWGMEPGQLAKFRELAVDPKTGPELKKRVDALLRKGFTLESFEALKRVPKGFDVEHPNAELLKLKGLGLSFPKIPSAVRFTTGLAKWLVERSAEAAPLVLWLDGKL